MVFVREKEEDFDEASQYLAVASARLMQISRGEKREWNDHCVFKPGGKCSTRWPHSAERHPRHRNEHYLSHLLQPLAMCVNTPGGSSTMQMRCSRPLDVHSFAGMGQKSNTRCSWSGTQPIAFAPNASYLFCPRSSTPWSGMSINETLIVYRGLLGSPKKFTTLVSSQAISPAWRFPPITMF